MDEAGTELEEVVPDEAGTKREVVPDEEKKKHVPVSLVVGLTVVCLISLLLALVLAILITKKYRQKENVQGEYSQVHTDP